jgi:nucleoside transporter
VTALDPALAPTAHRPLDPSVMVRLCIMMFLQFFVWGAWYVTMGNYMIAKGIAGHIAWAYSVSPLAAIVSPFFLGMIADRFFASERVLSVMHLLGALALFAAPWAVNNGNANLFIVLLLVHMLCYMPTINLTNTISFHNLTDQEKQFPYVRVFGTLGWIVANLVVSFLKADQTQVQFYVAGAAAVGLAVFSLMLPHTPPPAKGKRVTAREVLGLDAIAMLKRRSYAVFMISAFLICIPLSAYYAYAQGFVGFAGVQKVAATMSLGQMAEVLFMVIMPFCFRALGVKWMLVFGMGAWVLRYGLFAAAAPTGMIPLIIFGILLHGICYDFFFVTGFIYTDKRAAKEIRGQAQGFLVLVTYGLGMLIGAQLVGLVIERTVTNARLKEFGDLGNERTALVKQQEAGGEQADLATPKIAAVDARTETLRKEILDRFDNFWIVPCVIAGAVLVFFFLFFRDDSNDPVAPTPGEDPALAGAPA